MSLFDKESLHRLGNGESIDALCQSLNIDRAEFDRRWQRTIESRVPPTSGSVSAGVPPASGSPLAGVLDKVEIQRDRRSHLHAARHGRGDTGAPVDEGVERCRRECPVGQGP